MHSFSVTLHNIYRYFYWNICKEITYERKILLSFIYGTLFSEQRKIYLFK